MGALSLLLFLVRHILGLLGSSPGTLGGSPLKFSPPRRSPLPTSAPPVQGPSRWTEQGPPAEYRLNRHIPQFVRGWPSNMSTKDAVGKYLGGGLKGQCNQTTPGAAGVAGLKLKVVRKRMSLTSGGDTMWVAGHLGLREKRAEEVSKQ
ncbi:hypothetical protein LY78DRAFT_736395 [Colletotrichum sublineola]|nr:hypothetical protein LY78DRAFT_736395 [Colletotrichum sublineola]